MKKTYLGQVCLALAACIWGSMYVVSKIVLAVIQPLELAWLRYLVALFTLFIIGFATHQSWQIRRKDIPLVVLIGVIGYFGSIWAQFVGTKLATAQMGAVITSATPAFMVIFARLLLNEKITLKKAAAVFLATIGVLLIIGLGDIRSPFQLGGIILVVAALTWALVSVLIKRVPSEYSPLVITSYAVLTALLMITPMVAPHIDFSQVNLVLQPAIYGGVLYIGVVATAGGFFLWNKGLQMVDAGTGGVYFFFQPLVGTLLGWLLLGEQVGITFWIGALLIIGGVLLTIKE